MQIDEPLVPAKIKAVISPHNAARLSGIDVFDTIDSTNSWLLQQAKMGVPSGQVCLAEQQTAGRGRLGKSWYSPPGANLYCSLLWRFEALTQDLSGLGIAVGIMVVLALERYGIVSGLELKWPNDVLAMGRKLSGILIETNGATHVVIGIGLNLDVRDAHEKNWIDLLELTGTRPERNFLAGLLLNELFEKIPQFEQFGLAPFLPLWQKRDALLDRTVFVFAGQQKIVGVMRGINAAGELLLENETGIQSFRYGEVSVLPQ